MVFVMARRLALQPCASRLKKLPWRVNLPANISSTGKRQRRFFETKQAAETFCRQQRTRLQNYGRNSSTLTPGQAEEAAMAFERLAPYAVPLNTVVLDFIERHNAKAKSVPFKTLFASFTASRKGRSQTYLRDLKYAFQRFPGLHDRNVFEIEPAEVETEMEGMTPAVRNAFLRILRAVFAFGVKRGWLESNPASRVDFETIKNGEVVTLTPAQARALMMTASESDLLPYHALGLFAGIRPLELQRLDWRNIDLTEGHIEVTAAVSKTGRRRIIEMEPNLKAWLGLYVGRGGQTVGGVTPTTNLRKRLHHIRLAAGTEEWTQDVMRHSYASYWLAEHGDINRLTLQLGHTSVKMLWDHYNRNSKRKDATAYWSIAPSSGGRKIVSIAAA